MKNFKFPKTHKPFSDKYFLRAKEILIKEKLNPMVKCQVFLRSEGRLYGINEAIACIMNYVSDKDNIKIHALKEGYNYSNTETIMTIESPIQNIIDLETMYLGIISRETTLKNGDEDIDLKDIENRMREIKFLIGDRPYFYFGARGWCYSRDAEISKACFEGGASECSTDIGAKTVGKQGIGTSPHCLQTIYHWKQGLDEAVCGSTKAFDKHIDPKVPRIALVDYANREVIDTLKTLFTLDKKLSGIRIDTCGENVMEPLSKNSPKGVTVDGVSTLQFILKGLATGGMHKPKVFLSSGFSNINKVKEFIQAETALGIKLFDGLGGGIVNSRRTTMDIFQVEDKKINKVGRSEKKNDRLKRVI